MELINAAPRVAINPIPIIVSGPPACKKSIVLRYGLRKSSTTKSELTFGNDENGKAIAADTSGTSQLDSSIRMQINVLQNAQDITTTSGVPNDTPTWVSMGSMINAATVCDMKVATPPVTNRRTVSAILGCDIGKAEHKLNVRQHDVKVFLPWAMFSERCCSNPDDDTAFPSTLPPPRSIRVCQDMELKST